LSDAIDYFCDLKIEVDGSCGVAVGPVSVYRNKRRNVAWNRNKLGNRMLASPVAHDLAWSKMPAAVKIGIR